MASHKHSILVSQPSKCIVAKILDASVFEMDQGAIKHELSNSLILAGAFVHAKGGK